MNSKVRKIVIVGGGSAGWMAAAAFSKAMMGGAYSIDLVESEEIGTVGVGEATIPSIHEFNRSIALDETEFIRATQATFKLAIEFVDWTRPGHSYMHPFGFFGVQMLSIYFHHFWLRHHAQGGKLHYDDFCSDIIAARAGKYGHPLPSDRLPVPPLHYAYHFDAGLYAAYLRKLAEARGVKRHEGRVVDVQLRGTDGFIESIKLADGRVIAGDLFIDCSGFRGLLIEQTLHAGYEDWSEYLPCDRAMAVPCERIAATTPYTRSTSREAGWQWRIPLQHRTGNGYVYCSQFLGDDEAASLLLSRLDGAALNTPRPLRFVTGRRKEIWKKNCVALGLASGFLEPLESTSIHLVLASIQRLLFMFPGDGFDQATIDKFNALVRIETDEIRDFLVFHYTATERADTPFWRHCQTIQRPDTLKQRVEMFERSGNLVIGASELFREVSWFAVLMGQGIRPKAYHPFADILTDAELERRFELMSSDVRKRVKTYTMHDEFIRAHCAAPPIPVRTA
jgi:tryptophan halogenase